MADREKVIKAIECCVVNHTRCFDDNDKLCPYFSTKVYMCEIELLKDALALLKQEAVEPYVTGRGETFETAETWWYACGNCHEALDVSDKYCRHCGRSVKRNG